MLTEKQLWIAMAEKLQEIANDCADISTASELNELVDKIWESIE